VNVKDLKSDWFDKDDVEVALRGRAEELAAYLFPNGKRDGNHWKVGSIDGEAGSSFDICIGGDKVGLHGDFADGGKHSRSLLGLWMDRYKIDFKTALQQAAEWLGMPVCQFTQVKPKNGRARMPVESSEGSAPLSQPSENGEKQFNWQACVDAMGWDDLVRLGNTRWYSSAFCKWLHENKLVGLYRGNFAFPVRNNGSVVGLHYRINDDPKKWRHYPAGINAAPFIIGDLAEHVHVFESQWDMFTLLDVSGERSAIATRGKSNGAFVSGLIPEGSIAYVWTQNDAAGEDWQRDVCANTKAAVKRVKVPAPHKDLNDWARAGAGADELLAAITRSEIFKTEGGITDQSPFAGFDTFVTASELETDSVETFPLECLPPLIEAFAREVSAAALVPDRLVGCCCLGILSASIGKGLVVQSANHRITRGNIYVLASAESGSGKSESFRLIAKPLTEFEQERARAWRENDRADLLARRDILEVDIAQAKKAYAKEHHIDASQELKSYEAELEALESKIHEPCLVVEDITTERLALELSRNDETLASLSSDALSIVNVLLGRYNKLDRTDEGLYLKCYSGDPIRIARVSRDSIALNSPCLTALWLTQPDKIQSLLDEKSLNEGGLIPRLLACHTHCRPQKISDNPGCISSVTEKAYAGLIYALLTAYRLGGSFLFRPTPAALRLLNDHYNQVVERRLDDLSDVNSYAARWSEQAWRLAVCLHAGTHGATAHEQQLALETAQQAIRLSDWFAREQLQILQAGRTERKIERLKKLKQLVRHYNGTATLRDLDRRNNFKPGEVRELAARFPELLVVENLQTGGRPSEIVRFIQK
jgi:hypothetical protein